MAPTKHKAYKMLLNRISVDGQPVLIARQATLRLRNADGTTSVTSMKSVTHPKASSQLMEIHVDDKLLVRMSAANICVIATLSLTFLKGRWDLSLLVKHAAKEITQEFQANSMDKTLILALPMNNESQSNSFPQGYRDSSLVCSRFH